MPDWICEVLSPSTESKDRHVKMPIYERYGVGFVWLVDPLARSLEAFDRDTKAWRKLGIWRDADTVVAPPFEALPLNLADLWR